MWRVFPNVLSCLKLHTRYKFQFSNFVKGESDVSAALARNERRLNILLGEANPTCLSLSRLTCYLYNVWIKMKKKPLSLRIEEGRLEKLKQIAADRKKTMTQLIEDWIDTLKEEKPS